MPRLYESLNNEFFGSSSVLNEHSILDRIADLKQQLLTQYNDLAKVRMSPLSASLFTEDMLNNFFESHPSMVLETGSNCAYLTSVHQMVCFHDNRGHIPEPCNKDIIYITLPLYSFKVTFDDAGNVKIKTTSASLKYLNYVLGDAPTFVNYGHPHAYSGERGVNFSEVCVGNNKWIEDYYAFRRSNNYTAAQFMAILHRACIWLETVNLSDMYNTLLSMPYNAESIDNSYSEESLELYKQLFKTACLKRSMYDSIEDLRSIVKDHKNHSQIIRRLNKLLELAEDSQPDSEDQQIFYQVAFHYIYALWIRFCSGMLLLGKWSFFTAINVDIMVITHLKDKDLYDFYNNTQLRVPLLYNFNKLLNCPKELALLNKYKKAGFSERTEVLDVESLPAIN